MYLFGMKLKAGSTVRLVLMQGRMKMQYMHTLHVLGVDLHESARKVCRST